MRPAATRQARKLARKQARKQARKLARKLARKQPGDAAARTQRRGAGLR
jgi:hypothetical protein